MIVNKENMIDMLNEMIDRERANMSNTPLDDVNDTDIYIMGYIEALKTVIFAISVYGE